jgi:hypothetical protein
MTDDELHAYAGVLRRMRDGEKPDEEDGLIFSALRSYARR